MTSTNDAALIALGYELDAFTKAESDYHANGAPTPEAEAAEERRLAMWGERLYIAVIKTRATTPAGQAVKLHAMEYFNMLAELTPDDRIAEAGSHSEALAWAMVRDLLAASSTSPTA